MKDDRREDSYDIEYYLLDDEEVARVKYDPEADEYFDAEILNEYGEWDDCPVWEVLSNGEEISEDEAEERVRELGGRA